MNFLVSSDLAEFQNVLRSCLESGLTPAKRRERLLDRPRTEAVSAADREFETKVRELGVIEAVLPENLGGLGFGLVAAEVIARECGRALLPLPLFETIAVGICPLLAAGANSGGKELIEQILGATSVTGALHEVVAGGELCTAAPDPARSGGYLLSGKARFVPSVDRCGAVVVPARVGDGGDVRLFFASAAGGKIANAAVSKLETLDLLRTYFDLDFNGAPATLAADASLDRGLQAGLSARVQILACAEVIGAAGAAFDLTLDYVKIRKQFDRQIGSFQAIQHKLADMHTELERAASLNRFAAWAADNDEQQLLSAAAASAVMAFSDLPRLIESAIQLHGGIGFTYEYDLHLFLRRAQTLARVLNRGGANELSLAAGYLHG